LKGGSEQFTPEPTQPVTTTNESTSKIPVRFRIVEETADYLVVDKPPFLQAHPSKPSDIRTLWDGLRDLLAYELANGGQVSLINRLDRETSGLTLVAKNKKAAREFGIRMEQRRIEKAYVAVVWGWPMADEWTVDAPLLRQGDVRPSPIHLKQAVHPAGAAAVTRFRVRNRVRLTTTAGDQFSVVEAFPATGRMHQLRVHLAHSGHPIVGDKIYGPDERCYLEFIRIGWTDVLATRLLLPRHALHAAFLRIPDLSRSWEAPLPEDLERFLRPTSTNLPDPLRSQYLNSPP
jgi:23S rRNA pseudouridine1911/1915/1917 synthase